MGNISSNKEKNAEIFFKRIAPLIFTECSFMGKWLYCPFLDGYRANFKKKIIQKNRYDHAIGLPAWGEVSYTELLKDFKASYKRIKEENDFIEKEGRLLEKICSCINK